MIKFQWPIKFNRKAQQAEQKAALGSTDALGKFMIFGMQGAETPASALNLYTKSTAVSIPINFIAEAFAGIDPVIKMDDKIIKDHPVLDLLRQPSSFFSKTLLMESLATNYLATGEAELVAIGNINRPPLELQPISPANISVVEGSGGVAQAFDVSGETLAGSYVLDRRGRRIRYVNGNLKEIKQIRNFSTKNNSMLRGQSKLTAAAAEARQHILGNEHNESLLERGGRLSAIFHFDSDMTPEDFDATKERVRAQYGGAANAGEIGVTAGGKLSISELGVNNKDMDYANLNAIAVKAIALQYKVPLPLITNDASTFDNYKQAKLALYDDAVLPLADRIFDDLTMLLMPRHNLDPQKVVITYDLDEITALSTRRNEELKLRKELAIETDNELRTMIGREPYEGGDDIYKPATMVPVGQGDVDEPRVLRGNPDTDD